MSNDDWDSWGATPSSSSSYASSSGRGGEGGGWEDDTPLDPYAASKALEKEKELDIDHERDEALRAMRDLHIGPPSKVDDSRRLVDTVGSSGYSGGRPMRRDDEVGIFRVLKCMLFCVLMHC